jgi:hypothetical protein
MHVQHIEGCPDIGPICATQPQQPYQHDQNIYSDDLVLDGELGLFKYLGVQAVFTLRQTTDRIRFLDLSGQPYTPPVPDFHHRNETLVGPTDPWLMLHSGFTTERWAFSGRAGVTIPLGSTVPNPFELGREGLRHEHVQFGDGTWDPVLGASVDRRFDSFSISLWTLDRLTFGTNSYGYRSGHRLLAGLSGTTAFGLRRFTFSGGLDVYGETPESWSGIIEEEGNLGRTDVIIDLTASWMFAEGWFLTLGLKVPVYSFVLGEQTTYPGILTLGIATDFALGHRQTAP